MAFVLFVVVCAAIAVAVEYVSRRLAGKADPPQEG